MLPQQKMEKLLSPMEAAEFLRALADKLAQGHMEFGDVAVEFDNSFTVKQSIKAKPDKVCFKLKLKYEKHLPVTGEAMQSLPPVLQSALDNDPDDDDEEPQPQDRPSYKQLKKAMGNAFKGIMASLENDAVSDPATIKAFSANCRLMTTFPGRGDEHYQEFRAAADRLLAAAQAGDVADMRAACLTLQAMKKSCHGEHK